MKKVPDLLPGNEVKLDAVNLQIPATGAGKGLNEYR